MLERLVEFWLDNASERSYQEPFCQMLVGAGHKVLHSTRHSPIELGKDVISINPDGIPCAFQLKGNPGSRLTLTQFREIEAQLFELAAQPIEYPGLKTAKTHNSYLVTNGQVDEEVQLAIRNLNAQLKKMGLASNAIKIWARGELLKNAKDLGTSLWPSEVPDLTSLLELLASDGKDGFPFSKLHRLLSKALLLDSSTKERPGALELRRRISSAFLLAGICLSKFQNAKNHLAVIHGLLMSISYSIACAEKFHISIKNIQPSINVAIGAIKDSLAEMCEELSLNPTMGSNLGIDFDDIYHARRLSIGAHMAVYWLWCEADGWPNEKQKIFIESWMPNLRDIPVWGEGAVPELLAIYWQQSATSSGWNEQLDLARIADTVILSLRNPDIGMASPYYSFTDVMRHKHREILNVDDVLRHEAMSGATYTAEGLMHLLVRANLKLKCKTLWPSFNHLMQASFTPEKPWQYCLWRSEDGDNPSVILERTQSWDALVEIARNCKIEGAPKPLLANKFILLLFVMMFPHRLTTEVIRHLDFKHGSVWFIPPPIAD